MTDNNSIDSHLSAYVELFIARFDSIAGDWTKPWIKTLPFASQNAAGHLYSGVNDINLSLVCAMKSYSTPVWLTASQCKDLGIYRLQGETGTKVFWGGTSFVNKATGKVDEQMRWADYQKLTSAEKESYTLRENLGSSAYVWNVEQTDFPQKNPDTWANLQRAFSAERCQYDNHSLDALLESGTWYPDDCHRCSIIQSDEGQMQFDPRLMVVQIPSKELFSDQREFYGTLLHALALSSITLKAADNKDKGLDPLEQIARNNLSSELAAAVVSGRLGMSKTLSQSSLQYLKEWTRILSDDPTVIRDVTIQSRHAVQMLTRQIGIQQSESPDLCATIGLQIQKAKELSSKQKESPAPSRHLGSSTNHRSGKPKIVKNSKRQHI